MLHFLKPPVAEAPLYLQHSTVLPSSALGSARVGRSFPRAGTRPGLCLWCSVPQTRIWGASQAPTMGWGSSPVPGPCHRQVQLLLLSLSPYSCPLSLSFRFFWTSPFALPLRFQHPQYPCIWLSPWSKGILLPCPAHLLVSTKDSSCKRWVITLYIYTPKM